MPLHPTLAPEPPPPPPPSCPRSRPQPTRPHVAHAASCPPSPRRPRTPPHVRGPERSLRSPSGRAAPRPHLHHPVCTRHVQHQLRASTSPAPTRHRRRLAPPRPCVHRAPRPWALSLAPLPPAQLCNPHPHWSMQHHHPHIRWPGRRQCRHSRAVRVGRRLARRPARACSAAPTSDARIRSTDGHRAR